jgi:general stress protein YciG
MTNQNEKTNQSNNNTSNRGGDHETRVEAGKKAAETVESKHPGFHSEIGKKGGEHSHSSSGNDKK